MDDRLDIFSSTYEESKYRFINNLNNIKEIWKNTELLSHKVNEKDESLSIDIIKADANEIKDKLLIITTGLHGIEGYVGAAMLQIFVREYLTTLDSDSTGIVLVHSINPWGMKHKRRTNENNVDLNRNFIWEWRNFDKKLNKDYKEIKKLMIPEKAYRKGCINDLNFGFGFLKALYKIGINNFKNAPILGQYEFEKGIYYGGQEYEESTKYMIETYRRYMKDYNHILHLDLHTGYGPRNQMSIVNSCFEKRSSEELKKLFSYPLVQKADADEFYKIEGDMIDFLYLFKEKEFKEKRFYSTTFEFGTLGDTTKAGLKSLKTIIEENRLYWNGSNSEKDGKYIKDSYVELFYPKSEKWRLKAVNDFRQGFEGVLKSEGVLNAHNNN